METEINQTLAELNDACNRGDATAYAAVRDGGAWRFASFQNTRRTQPPGAPR